MKKSIFSVLLILIFVLSIFISCKTTPKLEEGQPGTLGWVTAARQKAIDFESPAYFPSEWEELESRYETINKEPQKEEVYNALADSYNDLFKKTVPLYAQAREDEIMEAREPLITSGFSRQFPEFVKAADDKTLAALDLYEAEEYYPAKAAAAESLANYQELQLGMKAYLARQEAIDRGFVQYDQQNFAKADEIAQKAISEYDAGNRESAVESTEEALLRYNIVLSNGWVAYAAERRKMASEQRQLALNERANIASRESFRSAENVFVQAEEFLTGENFDEAAVAYTDADALFAVSRIETEEKRVRAQEAIRTANERVGTSSETAIEAERIIEGGSR